MNSVKTLVAGLVFCGVAGTASAEIAMIDQASFKLTMAPYLRTDVISMSNTTDLDSKLKDDKTTYFGIDYSNAFDLQFKNNGPEFFLKLERNGPYDYDAPIFVHNTLTTSSGRVDRYRDAELLPHIEEAWGDAPLGVFDTHVKAGIFTYGVGHNLVLNGSYENYGVNLYRKNDTLAWSLYYCHPDWANKTFLGPRVHQERDQGIDYQYNKANSFATNVSYSPRENTTMQPYCGGLADSSGDTRTNLFPGAIKSDLLGTVGFSADTTIEKFSLGFEAARNFGKAKSGDPAYDDITHSGYMLYGSAGYDLKKLKPHVRCVFASGNKVSTDMVDGGNTFNSTKNRAFSVYSPANTNLSDSIYPAAKNIPIVAMGAGYGLNYGIGRPTTAGDPRMFDNLLMPGLGFEYQWTEKFSTTVDWWYLRSVERGVGTSGGDAVEL
ncbi:MAG: hypothetical protein HQL18_02975, partial [Candidatus Omnitrophica bacterium]|nr:hypothetical protein [Candidatus Omnitrophota bacterium]